MLKAHKFTLSDQSPLMRGEHGSKDDKLKKNLLSFWKSQLPTLDTISHYLEAKCGYEYLIIDFEFIVKAYIRYMTKNFKHHFILVDPIALE